MLGEPKNHFSLTRAALSTGGRAKSKFLSVTLYFITYAPFLVKKCVAGAARYALDKQPKWCILFSMK